MRARRKVLLDEQMAPGADRAAEAQPDVFGVAGHIPAYVRAAPDPATASAASSSA
jgi:hypothetical protein